MHITQRSSCMPKRSVAQSVNRCAASISPIYLNTWERVLDIWAFGILFKKGFHLIYPFFLSFCFSFTYCPNGLIIPTLTASKVWMNLFSNKRTWTNIEYNFCQSQPSRDIVDVNIVGVWGWLCVDDSPSSLGKILW